MPWNVLLTAAADSNTPIDAAVSQILGYGILGIVALALALRFLVPKGAVDDARGEARADLLKENERLAAKLDHAEAQRDEALKVAQVELVPVLVQFTATTTALIPLLQEVVRNQEGRIGRNGRGG